MVLLGPPLRVEKAYSEHLLKKLGSEDSKRNLPLGTPLQPADPGF